MKNEKSHSLWGSSSLLVLDLTNGMLHSLKSFCVTSSVSSITQWKWYTGFIPPCLWSKSCSLPQTFLCVEISFKVGSPGTRAAACVEGGLRGAQQLFHPPKTLWPHSRSKTYKGWAEERGGNRDLWPNQSQLAFALGFPTSWFKPELSFSFSVHVLDCFC